MDVPVGPRPPNIPQPDLKTEDLLPDDASELLEVDVPEERGRLAVVVLETDVSLGGNVLDLAARPGLPVQDQFAVELNFEMAALELDPEVVPFARGEGGQEIGRFDVVGGPGVGGGRRFVVDLDLDRMIDVVVARGGGGDAGEDPGIRRLRRALEFALQDEAPALLRVPEQAHAALALEDARLGIAFEIARAVVVASG